MNFHGYRGKNSCWNHLKLLMNNLEKPAELSGWIPKDILGDISAGIPIETPKGSPEEIFGGFQADFKKLMEDFPK